MGVIPTSPASLRLHPRSKERHTAVSSLPLLASALQIAAVSRPTLLASRLQTCSIYTCTSLSRSSSTSHRLNATGDCWEPNEPGARQKHPQIRCSKPSHLREGSPQTPRRLWVASGARWAATRWPPSASSAGPRPRPHPESVALPDPADAVGKLS